MAHWLKPFGTTDPPRYIDPDWIHDPDRDVDLDRWNILSGPSADKPPQMGTGDKLIFHAVHWSTSFGAGEILAPPTYHEHPFWRKRFPWVYPVRVDVWVPTVTDGPRTSDFASGRTMGRLRAGGPYAEMSRDEYDTLLNALMACPTVKSRASTRSLRRSPFARATTHTRRRNHEQDPEPQPD
jgi:hypothetical protein